MRSSFEVSSSDPAAGGLDAPAPGFADAAALVPAGEGFAAPV
jgi:hypothetical protein